MPLNQTCAYCKREFPKPARKRLCCDRSCAGKLSQKKKGKAAWSDAEVEYLRGRSGSVPFPMLVRNFRQARHSRGWPARTKVAVEVKLKRIQSADGLQRKCTLNNWTRRELARCLGISHDRVRSWCRVGVDGDKLKCSKVARNQSAIAQHDLKAFLKAHPERAADVEEWRLLFVLEDKSLVNFILNHEPSQHGYSKPVLCLTTGQRFSSAHEAERASFISRGSVARACRVGGKAAGKLWQYAA